MSVNNKFNDENKLLLSITRGHIAALRKIFAALPDPINHIKFVGGCVRNAIAQQKISDIDLATSYTPQEIMNFFKIANIYCILTGLQHGTVTAVVNERPYEITSLRQDVQTDGRHAKVAYTKDWSLDSLRRDFTINSIYLSIEGEIYDPNQGITDLQQGIVRFIGDANARIHEDYLRILRFFRFYAQFGETAIPQDLLQILSCHSSKLSKISPERIYNELSRILIGKNADKILKIMQEVNILRAIFEVDLNLQHLSEIIEIENYYKLLPSFIFRFFNLLPTDYSLPKIRKKCNLSNAQLKQLKNLQKICQYDSGKLNEILYYYGKQMGLYWFLYQRIYIKKDHNKNEDKNKNYDILVNENYDNLLKNILNWTHKHFPLSGKDLIALGMSPGKELGNILSNLEKQWIDSNFTLDKHNLLKNI